ncbi:MAG: CDP-diacylglycerol O-phosphatidyltransferase [Nocardioidaceae bacterium]|nr:CDP-diacylglycerol O-phosphatidyltransferase [Nocardioidaceae bacterium]
MTTDDTAGEPDAFSKRLRIAGWLLHVYTASGTVLALLAVVAAMDGEDIRALWILLAALVIDGTDGMLARRLRVKETIPYFDGARLDDIVDYITYAFVPMVLLWTGDYLPDGAVGAVLAAVPLLASSYQFCRSDAKTDDHFFMGFPSYWNVIAFYVVVLGLGPWVTAGILISCTVLVFVPIKYVYPSRTNAFWQANLSLATLWLVLYAVILAQMPDPNVLVVGLSLLYVAYYLVVSVYLTMVSPIRQDRAERREAALATGPGD